MPHAFSAFAMARKPVTPSACNCRTIGSTFAANALARSYNVGRMPISRLTISGTGPMKRLLLAVMIALPLSVGVAWAGPFEDAQAAYERGDYVIAAQIYQILAKQGNVAARYNLGSMYTEGKGVAQDDVEAVKWFRLAAAQGDPLTQCTLGVMYGYGRGVPRDYVRAYMWLSRGGASLPGVTGRDLIAAMMTPQQITEAQRLARECHQSNFENCGEP
jgi:hypothetical protein